MAAQRPVDGVEWRREYPMRWDRERGLVPGLPDRDVDGLRVDLWRTRKRAAEAEADLWRARVEAGLMRHILQAALRDAETRAVEAERVAAEAVARAARAEADADEIARRALELMPVAQMAGLVEAVARRVPLEQVERPRLTSVS